MSTWWIVLVKFYIEKLSMDSFPGGGGGGGHKSQITLTLDLTNLLPFHIQNRSMSEVSGVRNEFDFIKRFSSFLKFFIHCQQIFDSGVFSVVFSHKEHNVFNLYASCPAHFHCFLSLKEKIRGIV